MGVTFAWHDSRLCYILLPKSSAINLIFQITKQNVYFLGYILTHLCRMEFHTLINLNSSFMFLGMLGGVILCQSNFNRKFCKQTVENLIRRHVLWRLIWICTVCLCPTKKDARLIWVKLYITEMSYLDLLYLQILMNVLLFQICVKTEGPV